MEITNTQEDPGPTQVEVLESQLQIAEAQIVSLKAERAGLQTEKAELLKLIDENTHAQQILTQAAVKLSDEIADAQSSLLDIPEGLKPEESAVLRAKRQEDLDALNEKHKKIMSYIRGEL